MGYDSHRDIREEYYSVQVMLDCQLQNNMIPDRDLLGDTEAAVRQRELSSELLKKFLYQNVAIKIIKSKKKKLSDKLAAMNVTRIYILL